MTKRKLPIGGIQTFSELRRDYDVYVDKTMHIYDIASNYKTAFLARPRRFGKSLLCSMIGSLFRCEKEYFEGLAILETDWEWKEYPVIQLELGAENYTQDGRERLISIIDSQLDDVCDTYKLHKSKDSSIANRFASIIKELSRKKGPVVITIDEYDNPLLSTINQTEINAEIREELRGFFGVVKKSDQYLRFTFVTGITKFAQISMFSGANQLMDISMQAEHSSICGITQNELETCFAPEIEAYAPKHGGREKYLEKLKSYYDGYCFTKDMISVYNIYGILNHFNTSADFAPFWSISGEPSFARKYLESRDIDILDIESARMEARAFADYKDNTITLFPLLYQAGYLTIADYDERTGYYTLRYPNSEVRQQLAYFLASNYSKAAETLRNSVSERLIMSLLEGKPEDFMNLLKPYLNKVDYSLSSKITEYYFEFAVSNIISMLGLECRNEVHTANGRMDCVIFAGEHIYVFEFKVDKPIEDALWQLEEKDYASIFSDRGKKLIEIGVVFSREQRTIIEWKVKTAGVSESG